MLVFMFFVVVMMLTVQVRIFQSTYVEILLLIYYFLSVSADFSG